MPSISNQDYKHIYTGIASDEGIANAPKSVRKEIARAIENGTIYDCILHFNEGEYESTSKVVSAAKQEDEESPYYILLGIYQADGVEPNVFGIE